MIGITVQIIGIGVQIVGIGVFFVEIDDLEQLFIYIGIRNLAELRIIIPQFLAGPVNQPGALGDQLFAQARGTAQTYHLRAGWLQRPKAVSVGTQRIGQHLGIAPIILATGRAEPVAEPIQLPGVD